jgi:hypothetical protein
MSDDFVFPEEEKVRHRHLAWESASIPTEQEIDGSSSSAHVLFFCVGTKHLARRVEYKWVTVDSGTYLLSVYICDNKKKIDIRFGTYGGLAIEEVSAKIEAICASSFVRGYGTATPQGMTGKDERETLWIEICGETGVLNGYVYCVLVKEKVEKPQETPDKDNAAGIDFWYYF